MRIVIFGLTVTSSWGNGHATIWRGLCKALIRRNHKVVFFEKDVSYYRDNRDLYMLPGMEIILYSDWEEIKVKARDYLNNSDIGIITSYCSDALSAEAIMMDSPSILKIFYDLDTPVTLKAIKAGKQVPYINPQSLGSYDLVLSYTGGRALKELKDILHAKNALPLYGSVDPELHFPVEAKEDYRCNFSYLGTYAEDRQEQLLRLFIQPAERLPQKKLVIGGSQYPDDFPWRNNIAYFNHVPPPEHVYFYCSSDFTLNITRGAMAEMGYCPSGRLFEAAACGVPIISDNWEGLDYFYEPGAEILIANSTDDVIEFMNLSDAERNKISQAARDRTLREHTAESRIKDFETIIEDHYSMNLRKV